MATGIKKLTQGSIILDRLCEVISIIGQKLVDIDPGLTLTSFIDFGITKFVDIFKVSPEKI